MSTETYWLLVFHFKSGGSDSGDSDESDTDSDTDDFAHEYHLFKTELSARAYVEKNLMRLPSGYTLTPLQPENS